MSDLAEPIPIREGNLDNEWSANRCHLVDVVEEFGTRESLAVDSAIGDVSDLSGDLGKCHGIILSEGLTCPPTRE